MSEDVRTKKKFDTNVYPFLLLKHQILASTYLDFRLQGLGKNFW